jgi:hypothetical protein
LGYATPASELGKANAAKHLAVQQRHNTEQLNNAKGAPVDPGAWYPSGLTPVSAPQKAKQPARR